MVVQLRDIGVVFMVPVRENPLAQNLKRLRRSRAMTQEQLAERAGETWDQAQVSQIETGRWKNPTYDRVSELARALDVTVAQLYSEPEGAQQLPLDTSPIPHEQVFADLMALAQDRPDLLRTIRELREENTEEVYRQALAIIWRHMLAGMETARDLLSPSETTNKRQP